MIMNLWAASAFRVLFICCCGWSMADAWLLFFYLIPSKKNKLYNILCYASCKATNSLFCKAIFEIRHETRPLKYLQTLIIEFLGHCLSNLVSIRGTPLWFHPPDTTSAWRRNQNISLRKNISTDIWSAWQTRTPHHTCWTRTTVLLRAKLLRKTPCNSFRTATISGHLHVHNY